MIEFLFTKEAMISFRYKFEILEDLDFVANADAKSTHSTDVNEIPSLPYRVISIFQVEYIRFQLMMKSEIPPFYQSA